MNAIAVVVVAAQSAIIAILLLALRKKELLREEEKRGHAFDIISAETSGFERGRLWDNRGGGDGKENKTYCKMFEITRSMPPITGSIVLSDYILGKSCKP